jgi:hypothetical protein
MRTQNLRACAFDEMASTYDGAFTDSQVGRALREIVCARNVEARVADVPGWFGPGTQPLWVVMGLAPAQTRALLRPFFEVTRLPPLGDVLPPSHAAGLLDRSPGTLKGLMRLEKLAQGPGMLAPVSDHFILEATRLPR